MYVIIDGTSFFFNGIACKFLALLFEQLRADYVPLFHTPVTFLKMNPLHGSLKQEESARKTKEKGPFPFVTVPFPYPCLADNTCYTGYGK